MTKILIIDDDEKLSRLVQLFLSQHGYEVHTASSGLQGLQLAYDLHPDLVVLDIMMPGMDGWVVCSRLRDVSDVPIIMLTAKDGERNVVEGLESGADDYVVKPFSMAELLARIRALLRRSSQSSRVEEMKVFGNGEFVVNFSKREVIVRGQPVNLTPTEFELLACLVKNEGRVLPHKMLLQQVWGDEYVGETQYLKLYIRYLRQKVERDASNPEYILTEWGVGYRFEGG
ncbi:MAG: DNA-binding response regulator [Chloroflexi bacterium]|nr:response regulator transcription factor [Anaerolineae bacterium]RLC73377.1 MAG: DNA-binding response regulator [Chloroflexota bacterium]